MFVYNRSVSNLLAISSEQQCNREENEKFERADAVYYGKSCFPKLK